MHGDLLDLVLLALAVLSGLAGYRRGLICSITSFVGFLIGAGVGIQLAPGLARGVLKAPSNAIAADQALGQRIVTLAVVLVIASIGNFIGQAIGSRIRARVAKTALGPVDGVGGAVVSVVSLLALAWLFAITLAYAPAPALARQIHRSVMLQTIDRFVPDGGQQVVATLLREVQQHDLPAVSGPFATLLAPSVAAPDPAVVSPATRVAADSIVKVTGDAPSCSRSIEGSGFVYSAERVITNAHVVAGVRNPRIQVPGGATLQARVVVYDANRDIAVLFVPGLTRKSLTLAGPATSGTSAVVAGYPENGPFTAVPARIAASTSVTGPNIYQSKTVTRQVYTVRGKVRPGNSGGPLLSSTGAVYGVVFAASVDQSDVGYALTNAEIAPDVTAGRNATATVATQGCD
ncbi:MAG: MarP family serine protease [Actinomycetota bacterium]|nr:MarP family serine protease [Actinomycetota bacterium]